jgi:hypothetical protein
MENGTQPPERDIIVPRGPRLALRVSCVCGVGPWEEIEACLGDTAEIPIFLVIKLN